MGTKSVTSDERGVPPSRRYGPDNPHPLSTLKTQLVWEGKYDEYGRPREVDVAGAALPLQKIETIDEPRSRAEAVGDQRVLFALNEQAQKLGDFRNQLIWGDNKLVMASLGNKVPPVLTPPASSWSTVLRFQSPRHMVGSRDRFQKCSAPQRVGGNPLSTSQRQ